MKYKVLKMFTYEGKRYHGGEILDLTKEEAAAFEGGYIVATKKVKSSIKKKTK